MEISVEEPFSSGSSKAALFKIEAILKYST